MKHALRHSFRGLIAGSIAIVAAAVMPRAPQAQAPVEVLHEFGGAGDGAHAVGSLIDGGDGFLYGTTQHGGAFNRGSVYRMTPAGAATILHSFSGADGSFPAAGVVLGADGNLYGTAVSGGAGHGTIFRLTRGGTFTLIHAFTGAPGQGVQPYAPLLQASNGNLYGVTVDGTIFRVTLTGQFTVLHFMAGPAPYHTPVGGLVEAAPVPEFSFCLSPSACGNYRQVKGDDGFTGSVASAFRRNVVPTRVSGRNVCKLRARGRSRGPEYGRRPPPAGSSASRARVSPCKADA